jgi:mandelate racemase
MKHVLGTSRATVRAAPLLLVDLETEEGVTGRSYLFCYLRAAAPAIATFIAEVGRQVKGQPVAPEAQLAELSKRFTLIGVQGVVRMALSAYDVAAWDALAIAAGQPLATFLGGAPRAIPAYNSNGMGLMGPAALADEAEALLEGGFRAVKLRLGYPSLSEDLAALAAVRARIPAHVAVMTDYNQALSVEGAGVRSSARGSTGWRSRSATTTTAAARGSPRSWRCPSRSARTSRSRTPWRRRSTRTRATA